MSDGAAQDYLDLINQANAIFQKSYPGVTMFTAVGMPASGVAKSEADLTNWTFLAQKDGTGASLSYADGAFGQPTSAQVPWGLEFQPLPQGTIRLPQAIEILNQHGYTKGFGYVSLGTPVVQQPQPMFWFCVDRQTQGVSASTGEFFKNLFLCVSGGLGLPREEEAGLSEG